MLRPLGGNTTENQPALPGSAATLPRHAWPQGHHTHALTRAHTYAARGHKTGLGRGLGKSRMTTQVLESLHSVFPFPALGMHQLHLLLPHKFMCVGCLWEKGRGGGGEE